MAEQGEAAAAGPGVRAVVAGAGFVSLLLVLANLGGPAMSNDEAIYARWSLLPAGDLVATLSTNNYPPLYFFYLKAWAAVGGIGEAAFRLSSLPWWVGSLAVALWLYGRMLPERVALAAWVLMAFSPLMLQEARVAKYYMPVQFLTLAAVGLLHALAERCAGGARLREVRGLLVAWCVVLLAAIWMHYIGAVLWVSAGLWLVWRAVRERSGWPLKLIGVQAAAAVLYLPWLPVLAARLGQGSGLVSVPDPQMLRRVVAQLGYTAYSFAVGHTLEPAHVVLAGLGFGLFWVAAAAGLRVMARRDAAGAAALRFLSFHALVAGGLGYAMVVVFLPGLPLLAVSDRLAFVLPLMLPLVAAGREALPARRVTAGAFGAVTAVSVGNMVLNRENMHWEFLIPWREIRARIAADGPAEGRAVVVDSWHMGSRGWYYLRESGAEFVELRGVAEAGRLEAEAARLHRQYPTVWMVASARDSSPDDQVVGWVAATEAAGAVRCSEEFLVGDSAALRRLKEQFRRGSGVPTLEYKVRVLKWCASSPGS